MKNRKIAVTGATGMVGSHLVARLLSEGYRDITILARSRSSLDRLEKRLGRESVEGCYKVEYVQMNNPIELKEALKGIEIVFHCAARVSFGDDPGIVCANVEMAAHITDAVIANKIDTFVHVSSIAVLKAMEDDVPLTVKDRLDSPAGQSEYARSKFLSDFQVMRARDAGVNTIIVMPAVILGEGDWSAGGSSSMIPMIASGMPFHTGGVTGYVDVRDVARAMEMLVVEPGAANRDFVLCGGNLSFRELIEEGARAAGKRMPFIKAGRGMINAATKVDAMLARISSSHKAMLTPAAARSAQAVNRYDGSEVGFFINFEYTPIENSVARVVARYMEENK